MKKTYITPETLTVALGTCQMMAQSAPTPTVDTETPPVDPSTFNTKESKNVWDEEW